MTVFHWFSSDPMVSLSSSLFISTASVLSCLGHGRDLQVPTSVKAIKGSCVMVSCRTGSHDRVTWYKYKGVGYPIVYSTNTADISDEFRGRTSVPGNPQQGNCTLRINNIRQEDNGIKVYPWIYPEESDPYKYIPINIGEYTNNSCSQENSPHSQSDFRGNSLQ